MINPKILVIGATGRTASAVATQLLAKGWPVRAAVRLVLDDADRRASHGSEGPSVVVRGILKEALA
jgi:uncharacterized protein YbjT (DUF2867 family)